MPKRNHHNKFRSLVPIVFLLIQCSRTSAAVRAAAIGAPAGAQLRVRRESSVLSSSPRHHPRTLQSAPDNAASSSSYYVADYVGRFHYARHYELCTGPPPVLTASCPLGGRIELVKVSHPDYILCEYENEKDGATLSSQQLRCRTTCPTVAACSTVFLTASDLPNFYNGPYGEVYFRCIGGKNDETNPLQTTTGSFTYVGSDKTDLATTTGGCLQYPTAIAWNIRVAQLGVLCPGEDGNNINNTYVYDDHYVDCELDGATIPLEFVPKNAEQVTNTYSCYNGRNCLGRECNITFDDVTLTAEPARFADRCIFLGTTNNANNSNVTTTTAVAVAISAAPTPPPVLKRRQIVAKFRLGLGMERFVGNDDTSAVNPLACVIDRPDVTIRCTNGIIKFIASTLAINPCAQPDDATLVCNSDATGPATLSERDLHNITYTCTSSDSPMTVATLAATTANCPNTRQFGVLGVYCSALTVPDFVHFDNFFECGDVETLFGIRQKGNGNWYTCFSPSSSSSSTALPAVSVQTGQAWQANPYVGSCAQEETANSATTAPTAAPVDDDEKDNGGAVSKEDGSGSNNGVVIAVSVVGVVVAAVLLGILWVLHNNNSNRKKLQEEQQQQQRQRGKDNGHDPCTNEPTNPDTLIHDSFGGPPAPLAYDYDSMGLPTSTPSGGHTAYQVANVISIDGPIQDVDPIPELYFPRANGGGNRDDLRASQNSYGSNNSDSKNFDDLRVSQNSNSSGNSNVRFKDQAADNPTSNERFDDPQRRHTSNSDNMDRSASALSMSRSGASSRSPTRTRTTNHNNLPPHLRQKVDELSNPDRVPGNSTPHSPRRDPAGAVERPVTTAAAVARRPHPTTGAAGVGRVAGAVVEINDSSRYKADDLQSVIGEVQAVNGLPFVYPGHNNSNNNNRSAKASASNAEADQSMLPMDETTAGRKTTTTTTASQTTTNASSKAPAAAKEDTTLLDI